MAVQDESISVNIGRDGSKLWARVGDRVAVGRSGSRPRVAVYVSAANYDTRLMRAYDTFNAVNFAYPEQARRKRGRATRITDNAPPHKPKMVRRYRSGTRMSWCCTCRALDWS